MADLIVRDQADYPTDDVARASLPDIYRDYPCRGVWRQPGAGEPPMYVFTTRSARDLEVDGWTQDSGHGGPAGEGGRPGSRPPCGDLAHQPG